MASASSRRSSSGNSSPSPKPAAWVRSTCAVQVCSTTAARGQQVSAAQGQLGVGSAGSAGFWQHGDSKVVCGSITFSNKRTEAAARGQAAAAAHATSPKRIPQQAIRKQQRTSLPLPQTHSFCRAHRSNQTASLHQPPAARDNLYCNAATTAASIGSPSASSFSSAAFSFSKEGSAASSGSAGAASSAAASAGEMNVLMSHRPVSSCTSSEIGCCGMLPSAATSEKVADKG